MNWNSHQFEMIRGYKSVHFLNDFVIIGKCEININFLIKMYSY